MKFVANGAGQWQQGKGYRKRPILSEADLHCAGSMVQIVEIPVDSQVPVHHHKHTTEVFHVLQGQGVMNINGKRFKLGPGDTLTTEPNDDHDAANLGEEVFRYVVFKTNMLPGDCYWHSAASEETDDAPGGG